MGKRELLAKVKALAEQGFGGEKENAKEIFSRLLEKYGIDESEADELQTETELHTFGYGDIWEQRLLCQIIFAVTGKSACYIKRQRRIKKMGSVCTERAAAEIQMMFEFLQPMLKEELNYMYRAFIYKYDIFPAEDIQAPRIGENPEEAIELKKIAYLMTAINREERRLMLPGGGL